MCQHILIDINKLVYCSLTNQHRITKNSLTPNLDRWINIAGNEIGDSEAVMLSFPRGIFVEYDLTLSVADYGNDLIQSLNINNWNGNTVDLGKSILFNKPTSIITDSNGIIYIVDGGHQRILQVIRSSEPNQSSNNWKFIVFCNGVNIFLCQSIRGNVEKFSRIHHIIGMLFDFKSVY